jgi:hypothetical protein
LRTKLLRLFAVVSFALAGLGATTVPASADITAGVSITSSADVTAQSVPQSFVYHSTHDTKAWCREEGERLVEFNYVRSYSCVLTGGRYELWVDWLE